MRYVTFPFLFLSLFFPSAGFACPAPQDKIICVQLFGIPQDKHLSIVAESPSHTETNQPLVTGVTSKDGVAYVQISADPGRWYHPLLLRIPMTISGLKVLGKEEPSIDSRVDIELHFGARSDNWYRPYVITAGAVRQVDLTDSGTAKIEQLPRPDALVNDLWANFFRARMLIDYYSAKIALDPSSDWLRAQRRRFYTAWYNTNVELAKYNAKDNQTPFQIGFLAAQWRLMAKAADERSPADTSIIYEKDVAELLIDLRALRFRNLDDALITPRRPPSLSTPDACAYAKRAYGDTEVTLKDSIWANVYKRSATLAHDPFAKLKSQIDGSCEEGGKSKN